MPKYSACTYINTGLIFDNKPKMVELLENIVLNRFQCSMRYDKNKKVIWIYYGKWIPHKNKKKLKFKYSDPPNNLLLNGYHLQSLCCNRQIDGICREIETKYKKLCQINKQLLKKLNRNYQQYVWSILNHAIKQIIPKQVWKWLHSFDKKHTENINVTNSNDNDNENDNVINGELYNAFQRTFELKICPYVNYNIHETNNRNNKIQSTDVEERILEERIRSIMKDILKEMRQDNIISNGREYESDWLDPPLMNYKILRFTNEHAIYNVENKVIAKYNRKYRNKYVISFKQLFYASNWSHKLCGYVPLNGQKEYKLDMKNGKDEISKIIKQKLVSKQKCNIKLLLLLGCHSYHLGKIFEPYVENIICVHPHSQIDDRTCVKFSEYFYNNIASYNDKKTKLKYIVMKAFKDSMNELMKSCYNDNECKLHQHIYDIDNNCGGCIYHPNNEFLFVSANKQNLTREDHLNELKKYKQQFSKYKYEHPLQKYYNYPSIMIRRCDDKCYKKLKQYVNKILDASTTNLEMSKKKIDFNIINDISISTSPKRARSLLTPNGNNSHNSIQRGGSIDYEYNRNNNLFFDDNNIPCIDGMSLKREYCDSCTDNDDDDVDNIIIDSNDIIDWEWYESKILSDFSYSIIKCNNEISLNKIKQILEIKKQKEQNEIDMIFKKENTLGSMFDNDEKEYKLRWDICDVPICCCNIDAPHRVKDKLLLLIDGKVQGRGIKLCKSNNDNKPFIKWKSLPILNNESLFEPLFINMDHCITEPTDINDSNSEQNTLDFPIAQLTNEDDINVN